MGKTHSCTVKVNGIIFIQAGALKAKILL